MQVSVVVSRSLGNIALSTFIGLSVPESCHEKMIKWLTTSLEPFLDQKWIGSSYWGWLLPPSSPLCQRHPPPRWSDHEVNSPHAPPCRSPFSSPAGWQGLSGLTRVESDSNCHPHRQGSAAVREKRLRHTGPLYHTDRNSAVQPPYWQRQKQRWTFLNRQVTSLTA